MENLRLLWVDDEVDALKPLIIFLEQKGIQVSKATNGYDALDYIKENPVDIVLLDESMPGITGLDTLSEIKKIREALPVIMVTKNEEEYIMEEAIGAQISDYLIKPVNPNQVWLSLKKQFDTKRLVSDKTNHSYQMDFRKMMMAVGENPDAETWKEIYENIINWELKLGKNTDMEMYDVITNQKSEANVEFCKFIERNYLDWLRDEDAPLLSHRVLEKKLFPMMNGESKTLLILLDNFRYDQWKTVKPMFQELFDIVEDDMYYSILPTTTQYSRNALFAGMMPLDIANKFPAEWSFEDEDGGKNNSEQLFLENNLEQNYQSTKYKYHKITQYANAKKLEDNPTSFLDKNLSVIVYNFVDMLSHARTEMEVLKELASDDFAYRDLTMSWFKNSPIYSFLKQIKNENINILLTTDHGSIQVKKPKKVKGSKEINSNLRYKMGGNMVFNEKDVFFVKNPIDARLPKATVNSSYIFAVEDEYLCYPNNFGHYSRMFKDTYQHGGVSMEEVLIPLIHLRSKS